MLRRVPRVVLLATLLAAAACATLGAPSFRGYTGLVKIPTVRTLDKGEYNFGMMTEDTAKLARNDTFVNYGPIDNMEIGFNNLQQVGAATRQTFNAKYRFLSETEGKTGVAVGVIDLTDQIKTTVYTVVGRSLVRPADLLDSGVTSIRGHVGIANGSINGVFMGISAYAGNRVMFSVEWDTKDANIGFRVTPMKGLRVHVALFSAGNSNTIGTGMSYTKAY